MRKSIILFMIIVVMAMSGIASADNSETVVYGDFVSLSSLESVTIPVIIKNNTGLMGFKIYVEFPSDVLSFESAERGAVTAKGNFGTKTDNSNRIVILWNNTYQISEDGTLFVLRFSVSDNTKNCEIVLYYSEEDTFNEEYENTQIKFEKINLIVEDDLALKTSENEKNVDTESIGNETNSKADPVPVENASAVYGDLKEVFSDYDINNLNEEQKSDLLQMATTVVNNYLLDEKPFYSVEELIHFYEEIKIEAAIEEIEKSFSENEVSELIETSLDGAEAISISDIPEEEKSAFVEEVRELFTEKETDILNDLNNDELLTVLKRIVKKTPVQDRENEQPTQTSQAGPGNSSTQPLIQTVDESPNEWIIPVVLVSLTAVLIIALFCVLKKKQ